MSLAEALRKKNRTLLEMHVGMVFFGIVFQVLGVVGGFFGIFFLQDLLNYTLSLWVGVILAMLSAIHMYRTLDRSLDQAEAAAKLIFKGYCIRYVLIVAIMLIIMVTGILNPLVAFGGYMSLKVTALLQPITHKLCNKFFRETDPEPEPMIMDEDDLRDEPAGPEEF